MTHGQCDARPTVTFPATENHRPLAGTKLYCLVTEAHVCEQLAQGCYLVVERLGIIPATCRTHSLVQGAKKVICYSVQQGLDTRIHTQKIPPGFIR